MTTHHSDLSYSGNFKDYFECLDKGHLSDITLYPNMNLPKFLTRVQSFLPNTGVRKKGRFCYKFITVTDKTQETREVQSHQQRNLDMWRGLKRNFDMQSVIKLSKNNICAENIGMKTRLKESKQSRQFLIYCSGLNILNFSNWEENLMNRRKKNVVLMNRIKKCTLIYISVGTLCFKLFSPCSVGD